jgi:hypothetical protein
MDEFIAAQSDIRTGYKGWWDRILPQLTAERRESLLRAAASSEISHAAISVVLGQWGYDVRPARVAHWRREHVAR